MRKKLKARKYAEGGRVNGGQRPTEDRARMAADAAAGFDAEEEAFMARRRAANPWARGESIITNRPVGAAAPARRTPRQSGPRMSDAGGQPAMDLIMPPADNPPVPARTRNARRRPRTARPTGGLTTDQLNDMSLAAAREGRNMYKKGGKVRAAKKGKA